MGTISTTTVEDESTGDTPKASGPKKVGLADSGVDLADWGSARAARIGGVNLADWEVSSADFELAASSFLHD